KRERGGRKLAAVRDGDPRLGGGGGDGCGDPGRGSAQVAPEEEPAAVRHRREKGARVAGAEPVGELRDQSAQPTRAEFRCHLRLPCQFLSRGDCDRTAADVETGKDRRAAELIAPPVRV